MSKTKIILGIFLISILNVDSQTMPYTEFWTDYIQTNYTGLTINTNNNISHLFLIANYTYISTVSGLENWYLSFNGYSLTCGNANNTFGNFGTGHSTIYATYAYIPNPIDQLSPYKPLDCNRKIGGAFWYINTPTCVNNSYCVINGTSSAGECVLNRTWYNSLTDDEKRLRLIIFSPSAYTSNKSIFNSSHEYGLVSESVYGVTPKQTLPYETNRLLSGVNTNLGCGNFTTTTTTTLPGNYSNICFLSSAYTNPSKTNYVNLSNTNINIKGVYGWINDTVTASNGIGCFNISYLIDGGRYTVNAYNLPDYIEKEFLTEVTYMSLSIDNIINGYVWLPFDYKPIYNLTVNVSKNNYNINMLNNEIFLESCTSNNYNSCKPLYSYNRKTDAYGNIRYENIYLENRYLYIVTKYSDVNYNLVKSQMVDLSLYSDTNITILFSYGVQSDNEYCIDFIDADTYGKINNTIYSVSYSGALIKSGTYNLIKECFNSSLNNVNYLISASAPKYLPHEGSIGLNIGDTEIPLLLNPNNKNSSFQFMVNGTIYAEGIPKSGISISSSCNTKSQITNTNGYYVFYNISGGSNCIFTPSTSGIYENIQEIREVNENIILDFYLKNLTNTENRRNINIHIIYENVYNDYSNLDGAYVTLFCDGYPTKYMYSDSLGNALFSSIATNAICSVSVTKTGFSTVNKQYIGLALNYEIKLNQESNGQCLIYGYTILTNGSNPSQKLNNIDVKIYDGNDLINTVSSNTDGYYESSVICGKSYNVKANYNNIPAQITVKTPVAEGGQVRGDLSFTVGAIKTNEYFDLLISTFTALFGIVLIIFIMFVVLIFSKLVEEF